MKNKLQFHALAAAACALLFIGVMALVTLVDVQAIGPNDSTIGLATLNGAVRSLLDYNEAIYEISELLGYAALLTPVLFALMGLWQLVTRKDLKKVDVDLYLLAAVYVAMAVFYVFFELFIINYRPILMEGQLEASFPSSHTMLSITLLGTTAVQLRNRLSNKVLAAILILACYALMAGIVLTRLLSGVHWLTDILAGLLLGLTLAEIFNAATTKPYEGKH